MPTLPKIDTGPLKHVYDVIVLGGQLGGALAATLLAKRGYRVLLIEHDGMGAGYEHEGYLLPYSPFVAPALKAMPRVEEAFTELGLLPTVQRAMRAHTPNLQLAFTKHRVDLHDDAAKRGKELKREFGDIGASLAANIDKTMAQHERSDAFFKELPTLPPDGMMESWSLKGQIRKHPGLEEPLPINGEDPASTLVRSLLPFVTYLHDTSHPIAFNRPLSQVLKSSHRYPGGREGFRELLWKKLVDSGGNVLTRDSSEGAVAEYLEFDGSKVVGVKLLQSESIYRASYLIAATDAGALRRLIVDKKKHRKLAEVLEGVTTERFLFAINWVVPERYLPRGMSDLLLLDTGDPELGPLLVDVHAARRSNGQEDSENRVVCAGSFIPSKARDLGEQHLRHLVDSIGTQLERLMPFAREKVKIISSPYLDAGGIRGARLLPHPLLKIEGAQTLGITGLGQRTPVKNMFLASREVLPGLGLEGEFLVGLRVANMVQESFKKTDPLKG
ncbi:MAG: NAD(P)-binding protein [Myxococcaceae bacterium]